MSTKNVAIVGGGLAGLMAAYTLLKTKTVEVDLFEAESHVGGRVHSRNVRGQAVDFGGFLIYPWYTNVHHLFKELGLEDTLVKTPLSDIYYFLDGSGVPIKENEIPFPARESVEIWSKSFLKLLPKTDVSQPNLDRFEHKTVSAYLRSLLKTTGHAGLYETFFDTVNQGYCYGPAEQTKAAFMAPMVRQMTLHGDIRRTSVFPQGTRTLTNRLEEEIKKRGGRIHFETPVMGVNGLTLKTTQGTFQAGAIIFAQTVATDLYQQILPDVKTACTYTHFITAAAEVSSTPLIADTQNWGAAFYASTEKRPRQILSAINLASLYGPTLENCLMLNIVLRDEKDLSLTSEKLKQMVIDELRSLFPKSSPEKVIDYVHWKKTMPVAQETFVQTIRDRQGRNGYFFAGDFLGAPSMETAVSTGLRAAQQLLTSRPN